MGFLRRDAGDHVKPQVLDGMPRPSGLALVVR
jgi:hypothetical protein